MICPLCETENDESAPECAGCGKVFVASLVGEVSVQPVAGLEQTMFDPLESGTGPVETIPELEGTMVARRGLAVRDDRVEGVEHTQLEADPSVPSFWSASALETDSGREQDTGERTPAPRDTGFCPWCQAPATGLVCDKCGRRRSRYLTAPVQKAQGRENDDTVLCPACFARVEQGPRCVECGVPFAVAEVY